MDAVKLAAAMVGLLAAVWAATNSAGTDWSIPYALVIVVVVLVALRRTA